MKRYRRALCAMLLTAWCASPLRSSADDSAGPEAAIAEGKELFQARCHGCHGAHQQAHDILALEQTQGPDLSFAGERLQPAWLQAWLHKPVRLRPAGYQPYRYVVPTASGDRIDESKLPLHPALTAAEARAVTAYLGTLRRESNPYPVAQASSNIRAEVHFSKLLPCAGCHQARPGQGGISGPELYTTAARLNREWVASYISDPRYWQRGSMPRSDIRSDQLAAIVKYLYEPGPQPELAPAVPAALQPALALPRPRSRAERLYRVLCSQCHGVLGNGKGINAPYLFVAPRNHSSSQEMTGTTPDSVIAAIRSGGSAVGKSTMMPAWGATLDRTDIELLADYVLSLAGGDGAPRQEDDQ